MFERFTERARQVVVLAQEEARTLKHNYIGTEHILLGLLREEEGLAARVLESLDITVERVRAQVVRIVGSGEEVTSGQIPFTPRAKKVLELALREALSLGHNYIGTEHILLGLVRENEGVAARILLDFDADSEKIRNEVIRMLSGPGRPPPGLRPGRGRRRRRGRRGPAGRGQEVLEAARPVRAQPDQAGRRRQARPRRRPRDRDRADHADPLAPHEEQPGAGGRARRRQDRRRRGPRPADHERRRAGAAEEQADLHARPGRAGRGLEVPRRVRGAPEEGDEGDHPARRHHPVHRRAPQPRRRGCRGGRDRRRVDPQAGPGARRAADRRRDDARRVPQVPGARLRAGAALPEDHRRPAVARGVRADPQGPARPLRGAPQGQHHRRGARGRGRAGRPLHLRPVPAGQGDRPHRRGRLAHAHQVDVLPARLPGARGGDRDDAAREGGRDREPGVREGRAAARPGAAPHEQEARARGRLGVRRERRAPRDRRGGDRGHRLDVDGHPGLQAHRGRDPEADAHGGRAPQARHRAAPGHRGHLQGDPPLARRPEGPEAADRLVRLPRPVGRGQDGAGADAGRVPVRRRGRDGAHRHVGVHGEARRVPARRLASRLRRLRRGRPADRGGAPQAVLRAPARRDREGPPGRLQHPPADPGGRAADGLAGPHGRLPARDRDHDLEHRGLARSRATRRSASRSPTTRRASRTTT